MKTKVLLASLFVVAIIAAPKAMAQEFGDYQNDYSHDAADEMAMRSAQYASQFCSANVNPQLMMQQPIYEQAQMQQAPPAQAFEMGATASNYNQNMPMQSMQQNQNQPGVSDWQTQVPQESLQGQSTQCAPGSPEQQAMFDATLEAANREAYHNGGNNNGSKKFRGAMSSVGSAVGSVMKGGMGVAVPTGTAIGTYFLMKAAFGPLANPYMMTLPMTQALMMRAIMH
ncbi:MAG: hypothetical protein KIT34_04255 [Cyanobacteria bacterium TGS_CYA1]|nr:hypothetical protein [Cyanobacteria bacterium TGS_CYA1]